MTAGGPSPRPSGSSPDLFGATSTGRPRRRSWRIEIEGLAPEDGRSTEVRVTLVDAETGRRSAARTPFAWMVGVATGGQCSISIEEGTYQ